jgi:hypothetical protein
VHGDDSGADFAQKRQKQLRALCAPDGERETTTPRTDDARKAFDDIRFSPRTAGRPCHCSNRTSRSSPAGWPSSRVGKDPFFTQTFDTDTTLIAKQVLDEVVSPSDQPARGELRPERAGGHHGIE